MLIATGLGALQIVLDKGQRDDWFASSFIAWFTLISLCALIAFGFWEWNHKHPIVHLGLFKNRSFAVSCLLMLAFFSVLLGTTLLIPQFAQVEMGYTAQKAGELLTPGGFAILLFMPLVGFLVSRIDARYLIGVGFLVFAVSLFHMTNLYRAVDFHTLMIWRVYQMAGAAFLFVPVNTIAYTDMPPDASNQVSALVNSMRNMGGSIGISAVTTILARRQQVHQGYLVRNTFQYNPHLQQILNQLTNQFRARSGTAHAIQQAYGQVYRGIQQQASFLAYIDVLWILGGLSLLAVGLLFFAKKTKPGQAAMAH